jgi:hypothetical protein
VDLLLLKLRGVLTIRKLGEPSTYNLLVSGRQDPWTVVDFDVLHMELQEYTDLTVSV